MVFEALLHFHQLAQNNPIASNSVSANTAVHHQSLNLVGGWDQTYNRYVCKYNRHLFTFVTVSRSLPGGSVDHGNASAWSHNYAMRPIDADGLSAEGGPAGPFACDSDGFGCFVYNAGLSNS